MTLTGLLIASLTAGPLTAEPAPARAPNSHLWVVNELFSSADGTAQFIELKECCGSSIEIFTNGLKIFSDATGNQFTFPSNLSGNSAYRHLLLGTAAYAAMEGAAAPDFILPSNFFALDGDTIRWHVYPNATLQFDDGELPLDGIHSFNRGAGEAINTPTNYSGITGAVNVAFTPAMNWSWIAALAVGTFAAGALLLRARTRALHAHSS
jgi:hypothetical protein